MELKIKLICEEFRLSCRLPKNVSTGRKISLLCDRGRMPTSGGMEAVILLPAFGAKDMSEQPEPMLMLI